jgi:hypothetical protein
MQMNRSEQSMAALAGYMGWPAWYWAEGSLQMSGVAVIFWLH